MTDSASFRGRTLPQQLHVNGGRVRRTGRIVIQHKSLGSGDCRQAISDAESYAQWQLATTLSPGATTELERRAEVAFLPSQGQWPERFAIWTAAIVERLRTYRLVDFAPTVDGPYLVRYFVSGGYPAHRDSHPNRPHRAYTIVWYLNSDFHGGCTAFPEFGLTIRPRTGMALCFPSGYLHVAERITRGTKYIATCTLDRPSRHKPWI